MGFAAAAPIIAAGIGAASSASSGKGGGKGGGGQTQNTDQQRTNFAPFQAPAISRVFDILEGGEGESILLGGTGRDTLLSVPEQASGALTNALGFANNLLTGDTGPQRDLLNVQSLINEDLGGERFNDAIDRFETIGNRAEGAFAPFIGRALELSEEGVDPRFGDLLFETAQRDPAANPFVDRLVGDVSTDVSNAVRDQFIASGGLEASAAPQAVAREVARASNQIRTAAFESEANRSLAAQQAGAQFDATNASQRLNAAIAGGNITNQRFGVELGAASGVLSGTQAEDARRRALIGLRAQNEAQLASLRLAGLNAIPGLSQAFTELPFVPLSNFADIAFTPLGSTTIGLNSAATNPSPFQNASRGAGLGLLGADILGDVFDDDDDPIFGPDLGPLSPGGVPPAPSFRPAPFTPLTGINAPPVSFTGARAF